MKKLDAESRLYVQKSIEQFVKDGINESNSTQKLIKNLKLQIHNLEQRAKKNIADDNSMVQMTKEELKGIPQAYLQEKLKPLPNKPGTYNVPLTRKDFSTMMVSLENSDSRKKLLLAKSKQLKDKNIPVLEKLILKRYQMSVLLGYDSYSEKVLEDHMAHDPLTVQNFENDLIKKI